MNYDQIFDQAIDRLHSEGRYRVFIDILRNKGAFPNARCFAGHNGPKPITVWCSNDYLAMGQHPKVIEAMEEALHDVGAGSGGTRNIGGNTHYHIQLEEELADLHGKESALLFTSGYVSNDATLSTLAKLLPGCVIFSDELNHASMIEGIRHSKAERFIFRHNDPKHLDELLSQVDPDRPKLVAFESVYSMDGDIGPIAERCDVAEKHNAKHLDIGAELYDLWLDSLLETVKDCDPDFSPEVAKAWEEVMMVGIHYLTVRYNA